MGNKNTRSDLRLPTTREGEVRISIPRRSELAEWFLLVPLLVFRLLNNRITSKYASSRAFISNSVPATTTCGSR